MRRTSLLIAIVLLVAGCGGSDHYEASGTREVAGQPILKVVDRLGLPDDQITLGEETVYIWSGGGSRSQRTSYVSQGGQLIPLQSSESLLAGEECTLKLVVATKNNLIRRWEAEGSRKACQRLFKRIG